MKKTNLLITGRPGIGKTTVIQRVAERLKGTRIAGFVTEEMRDRSGRRTGFRAVGLDGGRSTIADIRRAGPPRVGKYGVDVAAIDELAHRTLDLQEEVDVYLIDEIGKMECLSDRFVEGIERLLDSGKPVIATIGEKGPGLITEAKLRDDAEVWELTAPDRDGTPDRIVAWLDQRP